VAEGMRGTEETPCKNLSTDHAGMWPRLVQWSLKHFLHCSGLGKGWWESDFSAEVKGEGWRWGLILWAVVSCQRRVSLISFFFPFLSPCLEPHIGEKALKPFLLRVFPLLTLILENNEWMVYPGKQWKLCLGLDKTGFMGTTVDKHDLHATSE